MYMEYNYHKKYNNCCDKLLYVLTKIFEIHYLHVMFKCSFFEKNKDFVFLIFLSYFLFMQVITGNIFVLEAFI